MTELLTAAQMRAIEQAAIDGGTVTGLELMERAGQGVVAAIFEEWPTYRGAPQSASILCGPGNNGGDGFVVARLLKQRGWRVTLWFHGDGDRLPADAKTNHDRWAKLGEIHVMDQSAFRAAPASEIYVDAVFGTGLSRPVEGELAAFLAYLAGSGGDHGHFQPRMVAVDIPSGLCADSGKVLGCPDPDPFSCGAPYSRLTVTFETPKPGHVLGDGPDLCGRVVVKPIGLERVRSLRSGGFGLRPIRLQLVPPLADGATEPHALFRPAIIPKRRGHKFDHGHVLVLTGGCGTTGAARLAARGALRIGAGLVSLGAPNDAVPEIAAQITALMLRPVPDPDALAELLTDDRINVICLGPGLGLDRRATALLETVLKAAPPPPEKQTYLGGGRRVVLDADALTLLSRRDAGFKGLGAHVILTPHAGEFARLFPDIAERLHGPRRPQMRNRADGLIQAQPMYEEIQAYRAALAAQRGPAYSKVDATRDAAERSGAVILFKGSDTVVSAPGGRAWVHAAVHDRAAPGLATAGAGDVLAGFIAGLMARGHMPYAATILAARLHVDCALAFGPGLIAEDLPEQLPAVLRDLGL